jgi:hypothetical protein
LRLSISGVLSDRDITIRDQWMTSASLMESGGMRDLRAVNDERAPTHYAAYAATFAAYPSTNMLRRSQFGTPIDSMPHRRNPSHHLRLLRRHAACDDAMGCEADDYAAAA